MSRQLNMTHRIGRILSVYYLATGLGFLLSADFYSKMIATVNSDPILINLSGMVHLFIGITILVHHFKWNSLLRIAVSLSGVMYLLKGASFIVLPKLTLQTGNNPAQIPWLMSFGFIVAALVIGYFSYFGKAAYEE